MCQGVRAPWAVLAIICVQSFHCWKLSGCSVSRLGIQVTVAQRMVPRASFIPLPGPEGQEDHRATPLCRLEGFTGLRDAPAQGWIQTLAPSGLRAEDKRRNSILGHPRVRNRPVPDAPPPVPTLHGEEQGGLGQCETKPERGHGARAISSSSCTDLSLTLSLSCRHRLQILRVSPQGPGCHLRRDGQSLHSSHTG